MSVFVRKIVERILFKDVYSESKSIFNEKVYRSYAGRRWRKLPYVALHHPIVTTVLALAALVSVWALIHNQSGLFQRLGGIIIACGAYFQLIVTSKRKDEMMAQIADEAMRASVTASTHSAAKMVHDLAKRGTYSSSLNTSQLSIGRKITSHMNKELGSYSKFEFGIISVGTLQASFGDWLVLFVKCRSLSC